MKPLTTSQRILKIKLQRRLALATPIGHNWDEQDMDTYLWYLKQTEAKLQAELETGTAK